MRDDIERRLAMLNSEIHELREEIDRDDNNHFGLTIKRIKLNELIDEQKRLEFCLAFMDKHVLLA